MGGFPQPARVIKIVVKTASNWRCGDNAIRQEGSTGLCCCDRGPCLRSDEIL